MTKRTIKISIEATYETGMSEEDLVAQIQSHIQQNAAAALAGIEGVEVTSYESAVAGEYGRHRVQGIKHWDVDGQKNGPVYAIDLYDNRRNGNHAIVEIVRPGFGLESDAPYAEPGEEGGLSMLMEVSSCPISNEHVPHVSVGTDNDALLHLYFTPKGILIERDNDLTRIQSIHTKRGMCELYHA